MEVGPCAAQTGGGEKLSGKLFFFGQFYEEIHIERQQKLARRVQRSSGHCVDRRWQTEIHGCKKGNDGNPVVKQTALCQEQDGL